MKMLKLTEWDGANIYFNPAQIRCVRTPASDPDYKSEVHMGEIGEECFWVRETPEQIAALLEAMDSPAG